MPDYIHVGSSKARIKYEQIARLRVASVPDAEIARLVNLTPHGLRCILYYNKTYRQIENEVGAKVVAKMDETLIQSRADACDLNKKFDQVIPEVLNEVVEVLKQKKDLRSKMAAATFLAERDPRMRMLKRDAKDANAPSNNVIDISSDMITHANSVAAALPSPTNLADAQRTRDSEAGILGDLSSASPVSEAVQ